MSPKNRPLDDSLARDLIGWVGVSADRPLVSQVSRFDPWKDPLGVVAAYRLAREEVPGLHLALVGSMALDDPQAWATYEEIKAEIDGDPRIHVFTNLTGVGNIEVNAFQRLSSVVVQKSLREGFGLVVSEAMWKGTPVVAGRAGGIPLQMADGAGGMLIDTVEQCADAIRVLLQEPDRARDLAERGRERVSRQFLLPRLLLNELSLMLDLLKDGPAPEELSGLPLRDPVCGMVVDPGLAGSLEYKGRVFRFCSDACRERFRQDPQRYTVTRSGRTPHEWPEP